MMESREKVDSDVCDDPTILEERQSTEKYDDIVATKYKGTAADERDMLVLGKKQVLRRNFKFITMLGLASSATASWEFLLPTLGLTLADGATGDMFWGYLVGACGMSLVYASIAEMASMSPTAGGQYHWVSEFAPPKMQKVLSYLVGWLCALGWQVYLSGTCFIIGTIIQGLIVLNDPTYEPHPFHGTLLTIAIIFGSTLFSTVFATRLPVIEGGILVLHLAGFLVLILPLWILASRSNPHVLLEFGNQGAWPTTGLAAMIGIASPMSTLIGYDCSVHMLIPAEEIKDASLTLPRALMGAIVPNAILGFLMSVTLIFTMGNIDDILATSTGQTFIQVFYNATKSHTGTNLMTTVLIVLLAACCVSEVATSSRQIWSFARDGGLPGSKWFAVVTTGSNVPTRAILISLVVTSLLACINLGSTAALNAFNSLGSIAILSSYFITISCLVWRRLAGAPLPQRRWSLGKFGLAVNIAALLFLMPFWFFAFWPLYNPLTAVDMNWSSAIFVGTVCFALFWYIVRGRFEYTGPVMLVKRD